jgi:hypothetical protein
MRIIRVFPRRTNATPDDDMVRVGTVPGMFDEADEVHLSVSFEWDKPAAELLAHQWEAVAPVKIGGPAYEDPGGEFTPGLYIKRGYVITSRGCPNRCWFCRAWRNEGNEVRELTIHDGYNVLDNNLLACSREHQERVFQMLQKQPERARFTGGLEPKRFTAWHAEWLLNLKPEVAFFAYDTPDDREHILNSARILRDSGIIRHGNHSMRCYVLIGFNGDTIESAESRLRETMNAGYMPMAMLYDKGRQVTDRVTWNRFQREWANTTIVGSKMTEGRGNR